MVYAKTFTTFARHAFQKASFAGHAHASPSGAAHASSFFNQNFAGATRTQLGSGAIANRFQSQFGAHAGKNNPSHGNTQTSFYGPFQNSMAASTTNDDGSKEQDLLRRSHPSLTRHLQQTVFTPVNGSDPSQSQARHYSTAAPDPSLSTDDVSEPAFSSTDIVPPPNLPQTVSESATPSLESYEEEVSNLMEKGDFSSVISVYHDMRRQGFVPTARLYNDIIVSMSRTRGKEPVQTIVETYTEMLNEHIQPEMSTVSTVIETLCRRSTEVRDIITETNLKAERNGIDSQAARERVNLLESEDNVKMALQLFNASSNTMYTSHPIETFNVMLDALGKHGMTQEVLHVYELLELSKIPPDVNTFVHLIAAFGKNSDLRSAIECYNEYKARAPGLPSHDENIVYEALILSYFACGKGNGGIKFLKKVQQLPSKYVSRRLFDAVVTGLCHGGDLESALKWVHEMKNTATLPKPTVSTVRPLVLSACRAANLAVAKEAFELLAEARSATAHLWKPELLLFADLCLREGDLPTAVIIMDDLILQNVMPDLDVAALFLRKLTESSGAERGLEYFERFAHVHRLNSTTEEADRDFNDLSEEFINNIGSLEPFIASRLISTLHPHPSILSQSPSTAARSIVSALQPLHSDTHLDGVTMAGLVKFQSALTGWEESSEDDLILLITVLCAMRPEDWVHLLPAQTIITENLMRIWDPEVFSYWQEIMNSIDFIATNRTPASITPTMNSLPSNYSPDDVASTATMDTIVTPTTSIPPSAPSYRQLPTEYHKGVPRPPDFNTMQSAHVLRNLGKARPGVDPGMLNQLRDVVRFAKRNGERLLPEALGRLIDIAGKAKRMDIVAETFEFAQSTIREVFPEREIDFLEWCLVLNSMIVANAFNRNFADARLYQRDLMALGVAPDADAFAAYIVNLNVTDTNDEATEALALFHEAKSLGVRPSTFLYNTLIAKLAKARRSDDALYYFHEMRANGIAPSHVTFGTIINACCRVGNEALALKYFEEMEMDSHFAPRVAPYNTMLQFYVQTKQDRSEALRFYEKMRMQLLRPSAHTYKLLMDAYATLEPVDVDAAERILKLIAHDGQKPTSSHYAALIHAYGCVKQDLEAAKSWFFKVIDPTFADFVHPDETLYQALIEAHVANHRVADCGEIFAHMKANNVKITVYMANHLIHGWTIEGNLEEARRVFDSLGAEKNGLYGREPSSYEQMTRTYLALGDGQGALALVEEMKTKGYPAAVVARVTDILEGGEGFGFSTKQPSIEVRALGS